MLAAYWAKVYISNLEYQQDTSTEMTHLFAYVRLMNKSMQKSLDSLATYDRNKAQEIAGDLNTFTAKALYDSYWREEAGDKYE